MTLDEQFHLPYLLEVRPSPEFSYEGAKNKLINLNLSSDDGPGIHFIVPGGVLADDESGARRQGHLLRLASWVDIESHLTVRLSAYFAYSFLTILGWLFWCCDLLPTEASNSWLSSRR